MSRVEASIAQGSGWTVVEDASLEGRNTFRVPAKADLLVDVRTPQALHEVLAFPYLKTKPLLVLGEGSNLLFTRDWAGVALAVSALGIRELERDADHALIRAEAGENWNDFVRWTLAKGHAGLENLSLIPGTVGAAPIQNIGAYGVEVGEYVATVEAYDRTAKELVRLSRADCAFAYRDSLFKRDPARYIVTAVEFRLPHVAPLRLDYAGVREELAAMGVSEPTPLAAAEAVVRLRTRKLPNPALIGNAGSFFKNPIVPISQAAALKAENAALPLWPVGDGHAKLSAAWLIEAQGYKGRRDGDAGVSAQHALVLVNHGAATGAQIWALAQAIVESTRSRFGVTLEAEPIVL